MLIWTHIEMNPYKLLQMLKYSQLNRFFYLFRMISKLFPHKLVS